jgi:hypothetical protein
VSDGSYFTYESAGGTPFAYGLEPRSGAPSGGTRVRIVGLGFSKYSTVSFGGVPGRRVVVVSSREIRATTPAHAVGTYAVQVRNGRLTSTSVAGMRFTWTGAVATEAPVPAGLPEDIDVELNDLDCPAPGRCVAVGNYAFQAQDQTTKYPLVEHWKDGGWTAETPSLPADAVEPQSIRAYGLWSVDCAAVDMCVATGSYDVGDSRCCPVIRPMVASWDGTEWTTRSIPMPEEVTYQNLQSGGAVSCPSTTACVALWTYDFGGPAYRGTHTMAARYDGATWTVSALAPPAGMDSVALFPVICPAITVCTTAGSTWVDGSGRYEPTVYRLDGATWSSTVLPLPPDAASEGGGLGDISCPTVDRCTALGSYYVDGEYSSFQQSLVEVLDATGWHALKVPGPDPTSETVIATRIACPTSSSCEMAGVAVRPTDGFHTQLKAGVFTARRVPTEPTFLGANVGQGLVCAGADVCMSVGEVDDRHGLLVRRSGDTLTSMRPPSVPGGYHDSLRDLVLEDIDRAVAIGRYIEAPPGGGQQRVRAVLITNLAVSGAN